MTAHLEHVVSMVFVPPTVAPYPILLWMRHAHLIQIAKASAAQVTFVKILVKSLPEVQCCY